MYILFSKHAFFLEKCAFFKEKWEFFFNACFFSRVDEALRNYMSISAAFYKEIFVHKSIVFKTVSLAVCYCIFCQKEFDEKGRMKNVVEIDYKKTNLYNIRITCKLIL